MIPSAAMKNGTASVEATEPTNTGYAVQATVMTKMSHTWLASHTGPIEWWAWSRIRSPRSPPPASRRHIPAPKSAPASTV